MIICICNQISEETITDLIKKFNLKTIEELQDHISVCNTCRGCGFMIENLLEGKSANEFFS